MTTTQAASLDAQQATAQLTALLKSDATKIDEVARLLDALSMETRIAAVRSCSGRAQKRLWNLTEGRAVKLADFVPEAPGLMVRHYGRNSLPAFTLFEKRFARSLDNPTTELWGYNHQSLAALTGPGYFVAYEDKDTGALAIDYRRVPPRAPEGWPAVNSNAGGIGRLVYGGMVDHMRKVSTGVSIGRAFRGGAWTENYFLLCRGS